jgi:hypothetical protein
MKRIVWIVALAASPALADRAELSVIGWNAEETAFAARVYNHAEAMGEMDEEMLPVCRGYIDHRGKPFKGSLSLVVYEIGEKPKTFPVQEWYKDPDNPCTPGKEAKAKLEKAKAYLAKLGIARDRLGQTFQLKKSWTIDVKNGDKKLGVLEMQEKVSEKELDDGMSAELKGKRAFMFRHQVGDTEEMQLFRRSWKRSYSRQMAGSMSVKTDLAFSSPTGRTVCVFETIREGNMRGSWSKVELVLVGSWDGKKLVTW